MFVIVGVTVSDSDFVTVTVCELVSEMENVDEVVGENVVETVADADWVCVIV